MARQTLAVRVDRLEERVTREILTRELREAVDLLRGDIKAGNAEIMTHVYMLHEDVIARLAILQEGQTADRRKRPRE